MARKTIRVGLVGVGATAQINHIPALRKTEGIELVALSDPDRDKTGRVAQKFQVPKTYQNFEQLLEDDAIDAVDICTPNYLHAPMAIFDQNPGSSGAVISLPPARAVTRRSRLPTPSS